MGQIGAGSGMGAVDRYPGEAHRPDEIVAKLWPVDGLVSQGRSVAEAVRSTGGEAMPNQLTYDRWRKERSMSAIGPRTMPRAD